MRAAFAVWATLALLGLLAIGSKAEECSNVASFWGLGMGARSLAMGEAFAAVFNDTSALFYNPAGLAWQQGTEILSTGESRPYTAAYGHVSARYGNIAGGLHYFDFGTITETDEFGNAIGSFSYRNVGVIAGLGIAAANMPYLSATSLADSFAVGLNVKLMGIDTLDPGDGFGAAMSLGFLIREDEPSFGSHLLSSFSFGVLVENLIGIPIKYESGHQESWVKSVAIGASTILRDSFVVSVEASSLGSSHFGIEWAPTSLFAIRAGMKRDGVWMPSLGIGIMLDRFVIDLAVVGHPYMRTQYRGSVGMLW